MALRLQIVGMAFFEVLMLVGLTLAVLINSYIRIEHR